MKNQENTQEKTYKSCYNDLSSVEEYLQRPPIQGDQIPLGPPPAQALSSCLHGLDVTFQPVHLAFYWI